MHETAYEKNKLANVINITHIINVSYYRFPKNYRFEGEAHDFWEFIYADKGGLLITAGDRDFTITAGELAFHKPGEFHNVCADGGSEPNATVVAFECKSRAMRFFEGVKLRLADSEKDLLAFALREAENAFSPKECAPPVTGLFRRGIAEFGAEQMLRTALEQLLIQIYRRLCGDGLEGLSARGGARDITASVKEVLSKSLGERVTLPEVARRLGLSVSRLKAVFRTATGKSVMEYLSELRIGEAKRLIHEGRLNFTQIAGRLGFENIHYFSRVFKEKTGMTPTEYSNSIRGR